MSSISAAVKSQLGRITNGDLVCEKRIISNGKFNNNHGLRIYVVTGVDDVPNVILIELKGNKKVVSLSDFLMNFQLIADLKEDVTDIPSYLKFAEANMGLFKPGHHVQNAAQMFYELYRAFPKAPPPDKEDLLAFNLKPGDVLISKTSNNPADLKIVSVDGLTKTVLLRNMATDKEFTTAFHEINNEFTRIHREYLFDVLEIGDILTKPEYGTSSPIIYIDKVAETCKTSDGKIHYARQINRQYTRTGNVFKGEKVVPILTVETHKHVEVFHAHYNETRADRKYIRYCEKMNRDYPQTKEFVNEKLIYLPVERLSRWIKQVLNEEELNSLISELKTKTHDNSNQSEKKDTD